MTPQDVLPILERYGFQHLKLVKIEDKAITFKFGEYKLAALKKALGTPSVTGNGKVAVFEIPDVGRLGVSPTNMMVRFIASGKVAKPQTRTSHLGKIEVPQEYLDALERAKVSSTKRTTWMKVMWEWANHNLFNGRLPKGTLFETAPKIPGQKATTRGLYTHGRMFSAGKISLAGYLFNARNDFILEVFFHEMCHQAAWCVDHSTDRSEAGHGPTWRKWMKHVGLDPRRFDPTENTEYMTTQDARAAEAELTRRLGKRAPDGYFDHLRKAHPGYTGPATIDYKGRALHGEVVNEPKSKTKFMFSSTSLIWRFTLRTWPTQLYLKGK
jgi:hypothetical protein